MAGFCPLIKLGQLCLAAAMVVAGSWYWLRPRVLGRSDAPLARQVIVPLTTYPGYEHTASFSPDGESVAFDCCRDWLLKCDIYIKQIGVEPPVPLTESSEEEVMPVWSPDGWRIHLLRLGLNYQPTGLPWVLSTESAASFSPVWMPAGEDVLFFVGLPYPSTLWRMATSGSGRASLVLDGVDSPTVSGRGDRLAYSKRVADPNIWQLNLSAPIGIAGSPSLLVHSTRRDYWPAWSPDSRKIAFTSDRDGQPGIWVCDADGSNQSRISTGIDGPPAWSPRGENIVFETFGESQTLRVVRADGGSPRSLSPGWKEHSVMWPNWSLDGRWIYFRSMRDGSSNVSKIPAEGGRAIQVTQNGGDVPQESPDGKVLYFQKGEEYPWRCSVWRMPVDGGREARVLDDVLCYGGWAVARSGIYYVSSSNAEGRWEIRFRDLETGRTEVVTAFDRLPRMRLALAPDNSRLLFVQHDYAMMDLMLVENFR